MTEHDPGGRIPNGALTIADVPSPASSWHKIVMFAHMFNGYEHWGSFERAAKIANRRSPQTLTELRTCLHFETRRWRHFGEDPDETAMVYIRGLLYAIRAKVERGEWD
jgi:hypothetical protein